MQAGLFNPLASKPPPALLIGPGLSMEGARDSWATFSSCGAFRYMLGRHWDETLPVMVVCMLNPSTADHRKSDPTVTRMIGFAKREECGGLVVVNAFAYRATDPRELLRVEDPVGPRNDDAINLAVAGTLLPTMLKVIAAWGAPANKKIEGRLNQVECLIRMARGVVWHLGDRTKHGHPRHPLYLRRDVPLKKWRL